METVTLTFLLTMLAGLLTFVCAAWPALIAGTDHELNVSLAAHYINRDIRIEAERKPAPVFVARVVKPSKAEEFLVVMRAIQANAGHPTERYTRTLNRMGV